MKILKNRLQRDRLSDCASSLAGRETPHLVDGGGHEQRRRGTAVRGGRCGGRRRLGHHHLRPPRPHRAHHLWGRLAVRGGRATLSKHSHAPPPPAGHQSPRGARGGLDRGDVLTLRCCAASCCAAMAGRARSQTGQQAGFVREESAFSCATTQQHAGYTTDEYRFRSVLDAKLQAQSSG